MNNETRILIVEDLVLDYELAQREIGKVIGTVQISNGRYNKGIF